MKTYGVLAFVVLALAATAKARQLNDLDLIRDVEALPNQDIVPRLLQELGLGDGPAPGAYAQSTAPATTPGAYASSATLLEEATTPSAATPVETPEPAAAADDTVTAATPAATTEPAAAETTQPAVTAPTAGTCPAGTNKVNYSAGILYCVLKSASADSGEVHVAMEGRNGNKIAIPTENVCYSAACVETIDALEATTTVTTMTGGNRKLKAVQGAEVAPFMMQIEETTTTPTKLSHSKCFYVCEEPSSGPLTVISPRDNASN